MGVFLLTDGGLQRDRLLRDLQNLAHLVHRHVHLFGDLLGAGVVTQLLQKLTGNADDLVDGLHHVDRDADGTGLVGNGAGNGLTDPPGSVSGELIALGVVELLDCLDQAQVTLLDQIQEEHAAAHVALGDGDHQTQIGLSQTLLGGLALLDQLFQLGTCFFVQFLAQLFQLLLGGVAGLHGLSQLDLFVKGQQVDLADLLQIHTHGVVDAKGIHQSVGVYDFFLGDLLQFLHRGAGLVAQIGQIILTCRLNAQIFQHVVDLIHLLRADIHIFQYVQQFRGGQLALLLAALDQIAQFFRAGHAFQHLHNLGLAGADLFTADGNGHVNAGFLLLVLLRFTHGLLSSIAFFLFCSRTASSASTPLTCRLAHSASIISM